MANKLFICVMKCNYSVNQCVPQTMVWNLLGNHFYCIKCTYSYYLANTKLLNKTSKL